MKRVTRSCGTFAFAVAMAAASQAIAQSPDTFKSVSAEQLKNRCLLMTSFDEETVPDNLETVALAGGWDGVVRTFGGEANLQVLCLGDQDHRAMVFLRGGNGKFGPTSPAYAPYWHLGDDGMLCFGLADDDDKSCAKVLLHDASGAVRLGDDGPIFVILRNSDGTPIYEEAHLVLAAVPVLAQQVSANHLHNRCLLMASFDEGSPHAYETTVLSGTWRDVIKEFGDDAFMQVLCLGDESHRASVYIRAEDGTFQATSPAYPPYWHNDGDLFCFGLANDTDRSCAEVLWYPQTGAIRLGNDGPLFAILHDDDYNAVYEDVHVVLEAVSPSSQ